jgi:hypothetical protein
LLHDDTGYYYLSELVMIVDGGEHPRSPDIGKRPRDVLALLQGRTIQLRERLCSELQMNG